MLYLEGSIAKREAACPSVHSVEPNQLSERRQGRRAQRRRVDDHDVEPNMSGLLRQLPQGSLPGCRWPSHVGITPIGESIAEREAAAQTRAAQTLWRPTPSMPFTGVVAAPERSPYAFPASRQSAGGKEDEHERSAPPAPPRIAARVPLATARGDYSNWRTHRCGIRRAARCYGRCCQTTALAACICRRRNHSQPCPSQGS